MADVSGGHHRSTTWSTVTDPKISSTFLAARSSHGQENSKTLTAFKSMRTIRQPVPERKAYPLPDPGQFLTTTATTAATPQSDASLDILYPMQSLKRDAEQEKVSHLNLHPDSGPMGEKEPAGSFSQAALKLPLPSPPPDKAPAVVRNLAEIVPEEGPEEVPVRKENKVVIVYDGEKKFTTAAVDVALREFAVAEGDAVEVVAFLEHIMSPMGMKMVADLKQFSGVNESILKEAILALKSTIERKLNDTNRLQLCATRKIPIEVKVVTGSNPKALVAKEIIDFQATCAIFDKNALKSRKYFEDNLTCHVLRLRSDGCRVETISLFGQGGGRLVSTTSHCSDDSSCSDSGSMSTTSDSATIWSKLKLFGSRRHISSGAPLRHSSGSFNVGSPRPSSAQELVAETLDESFSFDSPRPPNPVTEAFVYAAAGMDHKFGSFAKARNGEPGNLPTALAA